MRWIDRGSFIPCAVFAFILAMAVAHPAFPQEVFGRLEGRVVDQAGDGIDNVVITIENEVSRRSFTVESDSRGAFRANRLPVGHYRVRLARIGYRGAIHRDVRVQLGTTTTLGVIALQQQQAIELEPLMVEATAAVIDPTTASIGASLDIATFETLPTGRDYQSVVSLLPHANESFYGDEFNVAGNDGLENAQFVDGINVTDPFLGASGLQLPYNFVREIQVKQGGYEAEYGKALGAIVNIVTHSGGNTFDVNTFGYFTSNGLTATPRLGLLAPNTGSSSSYDLGVRVSGPLSRDRVWFSTAYNPTFKRQQIGVPGHGLFDDELTRHVFAGKLTWQAGRRSDLMLSVFGDPTTHHANSPGTIGFTPPESFVNPDPVLRLERSGGVALTLDVHHRLGGWLSLEATGGWSRSRNFSNGDTEIGRTEPFFQDITTSTWGGGVGWRNDYTLTRFSGRLHGTLAVASHTVKAGLEYEDASLDGVSSTGESPGIIEKSGPANFLSLDALSSGAVRNRAPTAFVQDSWRVSDRVTLNAGVRWAGQYLIGTSGLSQPLSGAIQPRLGVILQPGVIGSQKLSASFGRFYQQFPLYSSSVLYTDDSFVLFFWDEDPRNPGAQPLDSLDVSNPPEGYPRVAGGSAEHIDQFTLGYERLIGRDLKIAIRGAHGVLRAAWGYAIDSTFTVRVGNRGEGDLSFLPKPTRQYTALELSAAKTSGALQLVGSYVLSRTYGNYTGSFNSDNTVAANPGENFTLSTAGQAVNSTGLLPNDRTHVFKLSSSYGFDFGLSAGAVFKVMSGTPLNEFGAGDLGGVIRPAFLVDRGSAGRTPTIWDLNFRFIYAVPRYRSARLVLDVLHVGNPRRAVVLEQTKSFGGDVPNTTFGEVLRYQPPMIVRLGFELGLGR